MDPLSITTGVLGLLGVCYTVGHGLKELYDGIESVDETVAGILNDVEALTRVLTTMRATFDNVSRPVTGHVGTHWENIDCSLKDGKKALDGLHVVVQEASRETSILSGTRKHLRLKAAELKIGLFREQIRSFRETLQLSMQALILWNQTSLQGANDRIIPSLDGMQHDIRQLGLRLNEHIILLQTRPIDVSLDDEKTRPIEITAMTNMRNCMHSAATVVSSATTILGGELDDETASFCGSDWGDIFPSQTSEPTMAWLSSSALTSEQPDSEFTLRRAETFDSEPDLDLDLALGLYKKAQVKFRSDDYEGAEPLLRNCLSRLPPTTDQGQTHPQHPHILSAGEVLGLLCKTCVGLEKWGEAASAMEDKMALEPPGPDGRDEAALEDLSALVMILYSKKDYVKGFTYGRKLLRGYRKLGAGYEEGVERSLTQLVEICKASGNANEEEAYSIMLEDIQEKKAAMVAETPNTEEVCNNNDSPAGGSHDPVELPTDTQGLTPTQGGSQGTWMPASYWFPEPAEAIAAEGAVEPPVRLTLTDHAPDIAPSSPQDIPPPNANPMALASNLIAAATTARDEPSAEELLLLSGYFRNGMPDNSKPPVRKQLAMVGDAVCGKSLMVHQHVHGFQHDTPWMNPTIFEKCSGFVTLANQTVELVIQDTAGQEDFDRLRPLQYPDTDVVVMVFEKAGPDSLDNLQEKWISEVRHFLADVPLIIVGNKKDLEHDPKTISELRKTGQHPVTYEEGAAMASKLGAIKYLECSAKTGEGLKEVFEFATLYALLRTAQAKPQGIFKRLFSRRG